MNESRLSFCLFPLSNLKGREAAGGVTGLPPPSHISHLGKTRDSTTPAAHPVMRWKTLCRRRDGEQKNKAVMDRINKSGRGVITKLTRGEEDGWNWRWRWSERPCQRKCSLINIAQTHFIWICFSRIPQLYSSLFSFGTFLMKSNIKSNQRCDHPHLCRLFSSKTEPQHPKDESKM